LLCELAAECKQTCEAPLTSTATPSDLADSSDDSPLFVDLDGTLIATDSLYETLLSCARVAPLTLLKLPYWLVRGRARLKAELAAAAKINAALLPYDQRLCALLRAEKQRGRKIYLATAANDRIAHAVAQVLGLFDGVIASDRQRNLKGKNKLEAISQVAGDSFSYVANSAEDIAIWSVARSAWLVNASAAVERRARSSSNVTRVLPPRRVALRDLLLALRPHQWVKNTLIFVPLLTSLRISDASAVWSALIAFVAFCACASATYVLNDLLDLNADRAHSRKRERVFASGKLKIWHGIALSGALLSAGLATAALQSPQLLGTLAGYMILSTAYSLQLKRYVVLDTIVLAMLYTSRLIAGGAATGIELSVWLLAFALFSFLSLALLKRCAELVLVDSTGAGEVKGRDYRVADLRVLWPMGVAMSVSSLVIFVLYVSSPDVRARYENPNILWIAAIGLAYWLGRMWLKTSRGEMTDDPIVYSLRDRGSRLIIIGIVIGTFVAHVAASEWLPR
jgi:4-hydroxybenzoate polyprenyltransferase/phosphoserine phosphatase